MAKYEDQLARMNFLMEYRAPEKKAVSNIEFHANGADGKVYGILKEGTKYYIKTTEAGKENLSESYDYVGGFNNKKANEFTDYNKATKQLELTLMSLNEAYGKKEKTATVNVNRSEKVFANLTEEARKELDRMNQIMENSCKIGKDCICDTEAKGKSTGDNTVKNNAPFSEKASASLDKDPKFNGTVEGATENKEVKGVEADLKSDKKKSANSGSEKDYKAAHDDLDGEGVADKSPKGGKAVKVNESFDDIAGIDDEDDLSSDDFEGGEFVDDDEEGVPDFASQVEKHEMAPDFVQKNIEDTADEFRPDYDDEDDLDSLLEEFEKEFNVEGSKDADVITGPNDILDNEDAEISGKNGVAGEETMDRINEDGNVNEPAKQGDEESLKSFNKKGTLPVQSWDKLNEAIASITKDVYRKLTESKKPAKKESLQEAIDRMVKEEITKLDAWGKHPRFRKAPFTTPENKEVLAGSARGDCNDESAKGEQPYGQKIGDGKPFDKLVSDLTDKVMAQIKESIKN